VTVPSRSSRRAASPWRSRPDAHRGQFDVGQRVLTRLGYLYRNSYEGAYRVKAKYGGKLFEEKVDHFTGRRSI
jgi:hypothetical protein